MSDNKNGKSKELREQTIVDAACNVIRHKGFHQARMADIAEKAGVSYGLAYHYFKSKNDIFDTILNIWWRNLFAAMENIDKEVENSVERLKSIAAYFLDQYVERPDLLHFFISEISRSTANLSQSRLRVFKRFIIKVENIIKAGQNNGELRNTIKPRYLTYLFLGNLETIISSMVLDNQGIRDQEQKDRIVNEMLDAFFNGAKPA